MRRSVPILLVGIWGLACPTGLDEPTATSENAVWQGTVTLDDEPTGGLRVAIGDDSTLTDDTGAWELPAPLEMPAQVDFFDDDTTADTLFSCEAPSERRLRSWAASSSYVSTATLDIRGWESPSDVYARIIQIDPASGHTLTYRLDVLDFTDLGPGILRATHRVVPSEALLAVVYEVTDGLVAAVAVASLGTIVRD